RREVLLHGRDELPDRDRRPRREQGSMIRGAAPCAARLGAAFTLLLGVACTGTSPPRTAAYEMGYWDGCNTGYSQANKPGYEAAARKDVQRYAADAEYRDGWDAGDKACFEREQRFPTMTFGVWSR